MTAATLPKAYLSKGLAEPLPTTDGGVLNREPVEAITWQLSLALFMDAKLHLGRKRVRAKAPA